MAVDLASAKLQLNLTTTDDDMLVTRLITAAQSWLEGQLGYTIATQYPNGLPALDQTVMLIVGHFYTNREASIVGMSASEMPFGVSAAIDNYRNWSWADE